MAESIAVVDAQVVLGEVLLEKLNTVTVVLVAGQEESRGILVLRAMEAENQVIRYMTTNVKLPDPRSMLIDTGRLEETRNSKGVMA